MPFEHNHYRSIKPQGKVPSLSPDVAKRLENQFQANFGFWDKESAVYL
jgi:hypothetical protein